MKKFLTLVVSCFILISCSSSTQEKATSESTIATQKIAEEELPLTVTDANGNFKEWYPGHKQLKIEGRKSKEGKKLGIWKAYSKKGVQLSLEMYKDGEKNGFSMVKYPNGMVRYTGSYEKGERSGEWIFYDEKGLPTDTINYSKD